MPPAGLAVVVGAVVSEGAGGAGVAGVDGAGPEGTVLFPLLSHATAANRNRSIGGNIRIHRNFSKGKLNFKFPNDFAREEDLSQHFSEGADSSTRKTPQTFDPTILPLESIFLNFFKPIFPGWSPPSGPNHSSKFQYHYF